MNFPLRLLSVALLLGLTACSKSENKAATADPHASDDPAVLKHEHVPPHGGTAVVLGEEAYHLELVRDAVAGKLSAYVMDGELENFVRIVAPSIEIVATVAGKPTTLTLMPIANPLTGEKPGDASLFEVTADWLRNTTTFDGVIPRLEVRVTTFTAVAFNFPNGNEK
jgi:hypothetical protein